MKVVFFKWGGGIIYNKQSLEYHRATKQDDEGQRIKFHPHVIQPYANLVLVMF